MRCRRRVSGAMVYQSRFSAGDSKQSGQAIFGNNRGFGVYQSGEERAPISTILQGRDYIIHGHGGTGMRR